MNFMLRFACLVVNPITVYSYGFLFNCTTVGQASDSMTAVKLYSAGWCLTLVFDCSTVAKLEVLLALTIPFFVAS